MRVFTVFPILRKKRKGLAWLPGRMQGQKRLERVRGKSSVKVSGNTEVKF